MITPATATSSAPSATTPWSSLRIDLSASTKGTLARLGFSGGATPVQAEAIPLFLSRKDVAAEAVTGSGKTLAFVIPIVETLRALPAGTLGKHGVGAVVVSPTRELATQISEVLDEFLDDLNEDGGGASRLTSMLVMGGEGRSVARDLSAFEESGANVVVCTPGRMEDLLTGKTASSSSSARLKKGLKSLEMLILDEADRLLSLGFESSVNAIMSFLPKQRRTGLFSATQTKDVEKLIRAGMRNPVLVSVKEKREESASSVDSRTPSGLVNWYRVVDPPREKLAALTSFLADRVKPEEKVMLFFSTCASVEYFSLVLQRLLRGHLQVASIHGKTSARAKAFKAFRQAKSGILACTDVMARGIDLPDVDWVLQFDPPANAEAFVHRCGRTARIGRRGHAVLFLLPSEDAYVEFIRLNQKVTLVPMPESEEEAAAGSSSCLTPSHTSTSLLPRLREWQKNDRRVMDLANRAFVSSVQAYQKHECKVILSMKDFPFGAVATAFGLLKMPRMPELKRRRVEGFEPTTDVDFNGIKYKDRQKEERRLQELEAAGHAGKAWYGPKVEEVEEGEKRGGGKADKAWSEQKRKKERKRRRREAKVKKRQEKEEAAAKKEASEDEDDDDLEDDYRMIKRMRRGKASQADFDKKIELDELEDEDQDQELEDDDDDKETAK